MTELGFGLGSEAALGAACCETDGPQTQKEKSNSNKSVWAGDRMLVKTKGSTIGSGITISRARAYGDVVWQLRGNTLKIDFYL